MQRVIQSVLAGAILLGTAASTRAESVMKQCGEQWQSAKSAGTTNGATWPQFLAQCRAQLGSGAPLPAPRTQPQTGSLFPWQTPAAPASAPTASTAAGNQSIMKQCGAQWQAAKAAGTTAGATWPRFLKSCRAQLVSTTSAPPQGDCASSAGSCADAIGFTVSVAAASSFTGWKKSGDWKRICVGAGSSVSLSGINCRLGQRAFAYLPFRGHPGLRPHEKRRLHVRGRGSNFR